MYLIRADGNAEIGSGHLMRCLTIADALPERGKVRFLCADVQSSQLAQSRGYQTYTIGTDYQDMEKELPWWENMFGLADMGKDSKQKHVILVDSYFVTDDYLRQIASYGYVLLLDDMMQKSYPVDGVLNVNVFARQEVYRQLYKGKNTRCYTGSSFVPVRPEFQNTGYRPAEETVDILITTGGGDSENIAGKILDKIYDKQLRYHLICGKYNPYYEELKKRERESGNLFVHHDVKDMAGLMVRCQIAVTAGGTTVYELSSIGVPFVCFSYAENQEALTEYIGRNHIAKYAGAYHKAQEETLENIRLKFLELRDSADERNQCYLKETKLIDGSGAERAANILLLQHKRREVVLRRHSTPPKDN